MRFVKVCFVLFLIVGSWRPVFGQDFLTAQAGAALDKIPAAELGPGLLVYEFARLPKQEVKDGAFVDVADLGKPLKLTKKSLKTDWKYDKNNNAVSVGLLKIEKAGQYEFKSVNHYDRNALYIDGKLLCKYRDGEKTVVKTTLKPGYVSFVSVGYVEARGSVTVQWLPPGGTELTEIPAELLVHRIVPEEAQLEPADVKKPANPSETAATNKPNATAQFEKVTVLQATPEEAWETYRRGMVNEDYESVFKVSDEAYQLQATRAQIMSAAMLGVPVGKKDPQYQAQLNELRQAFVSNGLRDLTEYIGKQYTPTPEDEKAIAAIPDKLACVNKMSSYIKSNKHYQESMAYWKDFKYEKAEIFGSYAIITVFRKNQKNVNMIYRHGAEKTSQGWVLSNKALAAARKQSDLEQQQAVDKKLASLNKTAVELKLGTPEESIQTYRNAVMGNDWATVLQTLDTESQFGVLRKTFHDLGYTGFSGKNQAELDAQKKEQRALLKKYDVVADSNQDIAKNKNLQTLEQRRDCYAEVRGWLVQHEKGNEQGEIFRQQQLQLVSKDGDAKLVTLKFQPVQVKQFGETSTDYPTYVLKADKGQWLIDLIAGQKISYEREKYALDDADKKSTTGVRLRHRLVLAPPRTKEDEPPAQFLPAGFTPDSKYLVLAGVGRPFEIWDVVAGKRVAQLPVNKTGTLYDQQTRAELSPDGKYMAISTSPYGEKRVHGVYSFKDKRVLNAFPNTKTEVASFRWTGDGRLCVVDEGESGNVLLGTYPNWKVQTTATMKHSSYQPLSVSRTGEIAIAGRDNWKLFDAQGKEVPGIPWANQEIDGLAFSPDGQQLAIASDKGVGIFKLAGMQFTPLLPETKGKFQGLSFTPDGKKLIVEVQKIQVYDIESKQLVASGGTAYYSPRFSPDGRVFATSDVDGTVRIWDLTIELGPPLYPLEISAENYFEAAAPAVSATNEPVTAPNPAAKTSAMRQWSSADGNFKIEAEYVQKKQGFVQLKRKDNGQLFSIQIEKLSAADQKIIESLP